MNKLFLLIFYLSVANIGNAQSILYKRLTAPTSSDTTILGFNTLGVPILIPKPTFGSGGGSDATKIPLSGSSAITGKLSYSTDLFGNATLADREIPDYGAIKNRFIDYSNQLNSSPFTHTWSWSQQYSVDRMRQTNATTEWRQSFYLHEINSWTDITESTSAERGNSSLFVTPDSVSFWNRGNHPFSTGEVWYTGLRISKELTWVGGLAGYAADYSANFTARSWIDKGYADATYAPIGSGSFDINTVLGGTDPNFHPVATDAGGKLGVTVTSIIPATVGNILFVSPNGDNTTGQRANISKPYATIAGAKAAYTAGDVIQVMAGVYTGQAALQINGQTVQYNFEQGADVTFTSDIVLANGVSTKVIVAGNGKLTGDVRTEAYATLDIQFDQITSVNLTHDSFSSSTYKGRKITITSGFGISHSASVIFRVDEINHTFTSDNQFFSDYLSVKFYDCHLTMGYLLQVYVGPALPVNYSKMEFHNCVLDIVSFGTRTGTGVTNSFNGSVLFENTTINATQDAIVFLKLGYNDPVACKFIFDNATLNAGSGYYAMRATSGGNFQHYPPRIQILSGGLYMNADVITDVSRPITNEIPGTYAVRKNYAGSVTAASRFSGIIVTDEPGAGSGGGSGTFASDIAVTLSGGKTIGRYTTGQTIPAAGKTAEQVLRLIAIEYVNPVFSSFSITGQPTQVEVGTTLSGSNTFTWGIALNSGTVASIDLFDITAGSALLSNTPNDGTQAQTITTNQLNTSGAVQSWRGVLHDTGIVQDINSSPFSVTAYFYRFFGAVTSSVTNSATVRALANSAFHTGATTFQLNTGAALTKFAIALPPGKTIVSVFDLDALGADITASYVAQSAINVTDAGGTSRLYNIYEMNIATAYSSNHRHSITTN